MDIAPAAIAMQMAMTQQKVALSMMKQTADAQAQIADVLLQGATNAAAATRGNAVNITA